MCGLTKHSTQVLRCRYLVTVTLLVLVLGPPCCLPYCIQPQTVSTCRLGCEGLCSVVPSPQAVPAYFPEPLRLSRLLPGTPQVVLPTSWNLFHLLFSILDLAAEAQRGQVVHKGHTGA